MFITRFYSFLQWKNRQAKPYGSAAPARLPPASFVRVRVRGGCGSAVGDRFERQTLPILLHTSANFRLCRLRVPASCVCSCNFVLLLLRHVISVRSVHGSFGLCCYCCHYVWRSLYNKYSSTLKNSGRVQKFSRPTIGGYSVQAIRHMFAVN